MYFRCSRRAEWPKSSKNLSQQTCRNFGGCSSYQWLYAYRRPSVVALQMLFVIVRTVLPVVAHHTVRTSVTVSIHGLHARLELSNVKRRIYRCMCIHIVVRTLSLYVPYRCTYLLNHTTVYTGACFSLFWGAKYGKAPHNRRSSFYRKMRLR